MPPTRLAFRKVIQTASDAGIMFTMLGLQPALVTTAGAVPNGTVNKCGAEADAPQTQSHPRQAPPMLRHRV